MNFGAYSPARKSTYANVPELHKRDSSLNALIGIDRYSLKIPGQLQLAKQAWIRLWYAKNFALLVGVH